MTRHAAHLSTAVRLIMLALMSLNVAFAQFDPEAAQSQIEKAIKELLSEQLAPGEFLVYANVTEFEAEAETDKPKGEDSVLPYTSLSLPTGVLQEILERNIQKDSIPKLKVEVTISLDERLPEAKRTLLEDVIRKRFGFDGQNRILTVQALKLVTDRISEADSFRLEREKMQSEQARLALEAERSKLEAKQKEIELLNLKSAAEAAPPPSKVTVESDTPTQVAQVPQQAVPQLAPQLAIFKDFQLTAMAILLGFVLVIAIVLGGVFFMKGLRPLSTAIQTVGTSIETAAKSAGGSAGGRGPAAASGPAPEASESKRSSDSRHAETPIAVAGSASSEMAAKANEEFVRQVQDKIEILSKERNFSFYQIFSDMLDDKATLPLASAILVSLDASTGRQIVSDLSVEDIAKLRNFLGSEGGLIKAKELRSQALTDFYGRIAMEEFLNSPLIQIKDLTWLTKMTTKEMTKFVVNLSDNDRPVFLACLTPERVKRLLGNAEPNEQEILLRSLAVLDTVTDTMVKPVIEQISKKMSGASSAAQTGPRSAVDSAKYIAAVAEELGEADQTKLFSVLKDKTNLVAGIKEYFIPFASITSLPKELVVELFSGKSDAQVAQILFDSAENVRAAVYSALPQIKSESIRAELGGLEANKIYEKRNRKTSVRLQREISKYLQRLYAEGLLQFNTDENTGQETRSNVSAA